VKGYISIAFASMIEAVLVRVSAKLSDGEQDSPAGQGEWSLG